MINTWKILFFLTKSYIVAENKLKIFMSYTILDFETTSKEFFNRTANPWFNRVVAWAIKNSEDLISNYGKEDISLFIKTPVIIAFNAKFECLYLWKYLQFQQYLQEGGKIYCPQLAEYYITNFQTKMPDLRNLSVDKYYCLDRIKWLDKLLFDNRSQSIYTDVDQLPKDKVLEDVNNDVLDTESVYLQQQIEINKRGEIFKNLVDIQMDCLLATCEMEYNGICIDVNRLLEIKQQLESELQQLTSDMDKYIKMYWQSSEKLPQFKMKSPQHWSLLLFGGVLRIKKRKVIFDSNGNVIRTKAGEIKTRLEDDFAPIKGIGIIPKDEWKTKTEGIYKVNQDILDELELQLSDNNQLIKTRQKITRINKIVGTYCDRIYNNLYKDNCYRGYFIHCNTSTARLTSDLQQVPKANVSNIKQIFVSRFPCH